MRVILHGRVSTKDQEEGKTIDTQKSDTRRVAALFECEVLDEIWLENWSAEDLNRPDIQKIREWLKTEQVDAIINVNADRFSRTQRDQHSFLGELDDAGVKHIATTQPGAENLTGTAKVAIRGVNAMMSEFEKIRILERTSSARLRVVNEGDVMTSRPPFGLSYVRHQKDERGRTIKRGHFVHNPLEIENLKLILDWAKQGWSQRKIIQELFDRKIPTRNGKLKWQKSTIGKILGVNLEVYAGTWYYMKYQSVKAKNPIKATRRIRSSRKLRNKDEWQEVKLPAELIILSQEDVELIRRRKRENTTLSTGNTKYNYLLQRRCFCNKCNNSNGCDNFHGVPFYRCLDKRRRFPEPAQCDGGSIKSETLDSAVWSDIKNLIIQPSLIKEEAKKFVDSKKDDGVIRNSTLDDLAKRRKDIEKQLDRIDDGFREGLYALEEAKVQKAKVKELLNHLDQQEAEEMADYKKVGQIDYSQLTADIDYLCKDLSTVLSGLSFEEQKQMVQWLSLKVSFGDYKYSIEGSLPIYNNVGNANSRPFSFIKRSPRCWQNNAC